MKNPTNKPKKRYNVKAKPIHYRVVQNLLDNGGVKSKAILDAGYSKAMAHNPDRVMESRGFIEAMNSAGLSVDTLNTYLAQDLKAKPKQRLGELTLAYKLHGKLRENVTENKTLILITSGESATRYSLPTTTHVDEDVKE
jgi:hypothetical protein